MNKIETKEKNLNFEKSTLSPFAQNVTQGNKVNNEYIKNEIPNGQNDKNNQNCNSICNIFPYVIYDQLYNESLSLFLEDEDNEFSLNNHVSFNKLKEEEQNLFMEKIIDIISIEKCNQKALNFHFLNIKPANRGSFIEYLKYSRYYIEAKINHLIRFIIFLVYICLRIYISINQYQCIEERAEDNNYWECSKFGKCKVIHHFLTLPNICRLIYLFIFYFTFYIYKSFFLCSYKKCRMPKWFIIFYKSAQYLFLVIILIFDYIDRTKCVKIKNNNHLFVMVDNLELINFIFAILDIFINIFK